MDARPTVHVDDCVPAIVRIPLSLVVATPAKAPAPNDLANFAVVKFICLPVKYATAPSLAKRAAELARPIPTTRAAAAVTLPIVDVTLASPVAPAIA